MIHVVRFDRIHRLCADRHSALLAQRWRLIVLLAASYIFYAGWRAPYLLLIVFSTLVDYFAAQVIDRSPRARKPQRRIFLLCSITANLGVLFVFKYFNLFSAAASDVSAMLGIPLEARWLHVTLPVGISFYTFQSMAYTIDVYRGRLPACQNLGTFALYVAFFPQLVAGPIERATNMLPQFARKLAFDYDRAVRGLRLILWGLFKKLVIADRLAIYVDAVYGDLQSHSGFSLIVATLFFTFQIYCDFSGYSDIAIGLARLMGFDLMQNFRRPYLARSISEFWRRWHISLSTWFRDYVYISLGGNRKGLPRQILNLMLVFALSGLWHGANWTFVIWGIYHGAIVAIETVLNACKVRLVPRNTFGHVIKLLYALVFTFLGWILFRANRIEDIQYILRHMFDFSEGFAGLTDPFSAGLLPQRLEFFISFVLISFLLAVDVVDEHAGINSHFARLTVVWRWTVYYLFLIAIYISLFYQATKQEFIYFQF